MFEHIYYSIVVPFLFLSLYARLHSFSLTLPLFYMSVFFFHLLKLITSFPLFLQSKMPFTKFQTQVSYNQIYLCTIPAILLLLLLLWVFFCKWLILCWSDFAANLLVVEPKLQNVLFTVSSLLAAKCPS